MCADFKHFVLSHSISHTCTHYATWLQQVEGVRLDAIMSVCVCACTLLWQAIILDAGYIFDLAWFNGIIY